MPINIDNVQITGGLTFIPEILTPSGDPYWANVSLLMNNTTTNNQTNNTFLDSSTNIFPVTRVSTPTQGSFTPFTVAANTPYSASTNGSSGYFVTGSYLSVNYNSALVFGTGDFTVECWVYILSNSPANTDNVRRATIASCIYSFTNSGWAFRIAGNSSTTGTGLNFENRQGGSLAGFTANATLAQRQWHHVALVRNGTSTRVYLNGTDIGGGTLSDQNIVSNAPLWIGRQNYTGYTEEFNGFMSGLRIVKGAAVYTGNFTPPSAPLTAISGTSLLLNFTNAGIFDGATKNNLITLGDAKVSTTQAKFGTTSVSFDGTGDALTMPDSDTFTMGSGNFTIEGWVYTGVSNSSMRLLGQMTTSVITSTVSFALYTTSGKLISSAWVGSTFYGAVSTNNLPLNQWVHIAFVRNGSTLTQYINGVSDSDGSGANRNIGVNSINNSTNNLSIGRLGDYNAEYWNGFVQDIRITKGVARYTDNFTPPTQPFPTY